MTLCFKWATAVNGFGMTVVGFKDTQATRQKTDLGPESGSEEVEERDYCQVDWRTENSLSLCTESHSENCS